MKKNILSLWIAVILILLLATGCKKDPGTTPPPVIPPPPVKPLPPVITSITPSTGAADTVVTVTGTDFGATPTDNTVAFNGIAATVQTATTTTLTVLAPASGTSGAVTVTTGAGKATGPVFTYASTDLYLAGKTPAGWGYWKNGVFTGIPSDCSNLKGLFVSGTDVYVGGVDNNLLPKYWKNGVGVSVPVSTGHNEGEVTGLFVSGTDVYACGDDNGNSAYSVPKIWKNGTAMPITYQYGGDVFAIFISGTDVYAAGDQWSETRGGNSIATYWKNGVPVALTNGTFNSFARGIYVSGNDVYVAGTDGGAAETWKNGVATVLQVPNPAYSGVADAIYVLGADVYVAGDYRSTAKYWKNGVMNDLSATIPGNLATDDAVGITGKGTDIYMVGNVSSKGYGYWKNGIFQLVQGSDFLNRIFVQ